MKICVIGNSHVGSLKSGWDEIRSRHPGVELTFFAAYGTNLNRLTVRGDALVAKDEELQKFLAYTSGGLDTIVPGDYDAVLIHALRFFLPALDQRLSSAVCSAACHDGFVRSLNYQVASKIRRISEVPLYLGHVPLEAGTPDRELPPLRSYAQVFDLVQTHRIVGGARYVPQPAATLGEHWSTNSAYAKGAVRLDIGEGGRTMHADHDVKHMNARFGSEYLRSFFELLPPT